MTEPLSLTVARTWTPGYFSWKAGQQGREEAFAGDRTGRNRQIARDGRPEAADVRPGLPVQVEDLPGILIEPLTRFGEGDSSGPAIEQRDAKLSFEHGDSLADGRLGDRPSRRRGGEAPTLRDRCERREVRKLDKASGGG